MTKEAFFHPPRTINCKGKIINLSAPLVMGVMNITPDSFYDGGSYRNPLDAIKKAEQFLDEGADILDMGAASSRPGAAIIHPEEEQDRLLPALKAVVRQFPEAVISIDTYHSSTARIAIEAGAHLINDISAGEIDKQMFNTVAELQVPYIMMHMQGRPDNMQLEPSYHHLIKDIAFYFSEKVSILKEKGVHDIILDPGFGFGKTLEQNYQLLAGLDYFRMFELPLLVGVSRKSMINKVLGVPPSRALNGTTVLNTLAIEQGADIIRVHDVREASEVIKICSFYQKQR